MKHESQSDILTLKQASVLLNCHPNTLRKWADQGKIKVIRFGSRGDRRFKRSEITKLLSEAERSAGSKSWFKFIDLFAGIGGTRFPFDASKGGIGGECVFTSEYEKFATQTYAANFPDDHEIAGDITQIDEKNIPDHDLLIAGFPCQPFSIAGVSKKKSMGRAHGFADRTQGTLFFDVARIIAHKKPAAFLLENVKNLKSHDKGRTFKTIYSTLTEELGYKVQYRIINAGHFVPQHRERIYLVGFRDDTEFDFDELSLPNSIQRPIMGSVLHPENGSEKPEPPYTEGKKAKVNGKYTLSDKLWEYLQVYAAKHRAQGNGFGFGMVDRGSVSRTLSARYYKDGSEVLVSRGKKNPRKLTPRECARLMGFPDDFCIPVSDTQAYKQFGNSVVVPAIRSIAELMQPHLMKSVLGENHVAGQKKEELTPAL